MSASRGTNRGGVLVSDFDGTRFETGKGLLMEIPTSSPYWSPTLGVDKTGVVRDFLNQGLTVAFAGDGFPDAEPARLVPAERRFARGDLAGVLRGEHLLFYPYDVWSDIASRLLQRGGCCQHPLPTQAASATMET